ncbi:MAG: hypothetical protein EXS05_05310 [Planctomycetaceae bacterium]|nr:hypothetical protein [Planctomycetaceae bacterium]
MIQSVRSDSTNLKSVQVKSSSSVLLPERAKQAIESAAAVTGGAGVLKLMRRVIVFILGISVLLVGLLMVIGPGPAIVVIPLGLAILATEFVWAKKTLDWGRARFEGIKQRVKPPNPSD